MPGKLNRIIGIASIVAPGLHLLSDILELFSGGFTSRQLLINYVAFLAMPFLIIGLCFVQRDVLRWYGLLGAVIYGVSFIYFAHSTMVALESSISSYAGLWNQLGGLYTFHGGLMVVGGLLFGFGSLHAGIISRSGVTVFVIGVCLNLLLSLSPMSAEYQIIGSSMRNLGLIIIGSSILTMNERTETNAES